jgi:serine/threonine-protein kinase HipA
VPTPDVQALQVLLHGTHIATITNLGADRTILSFEASYEADPARPTLSLSFKDALGQLLPQARVYNTALMPFFSNLLPEGHLREYLAQRGHVHPKREFYLLWLLGQDLPGALVVKPPNGQQLPPVSDDSKENNTGRAGEARAAPPLRFSLAGVQLKFSALRSSSGGLTIPASGVGGDWIVKLPSERFEAVPENEFSMLELARRVGIGVPVAKLIDLKDIDKLPEGLGSLRGSQVLAVARFDRMPAGDAIHMEDFAQVFGLYPDDKYKTRSLMNIAKVLSAEGEYDDVLEFIRRITFNALIGNADSHLKNWSLLYPNRRSPRLSPAYDLVCTIAYIQDDNAALKYSRTRKFSELTLEEFSHLASRAGLPEAAVLNTLKETVARFQEHWARERAHLPLSAAVISGITAQLAKIPLVRQVKY